MLFLKAIKNCEDTVIITITLLMMIALIIYGICSYRAMGDIDDIISNPTFTGVIARKGVSERTSTFGPSNTLYLLHIIGEYAGYDGRVPVDHIFIVPAEMHRMFEVGDSISNLASTLVRQET